MFLFIFYFSVLEIPEMVKDLKANRFLNDMLNFLLHIFSNFTSILALLVEYVDRGSIIYAKTNDG